MRLSVIVVAFGVFFPITVTTLDGLRSVDHEAVKMMHIQTNSGSQ